MPTIQSESWAGRLRILASLTGIGSALVWFFMDGDVYTAMAYSSSFCWIQTKEQGWLVLGLALAFGAVSIVGASGSLFFRRRPLSWVILVAALILQPIWYYEVGETETTTIPAVLQGS